MIADTIRNSNLTQTIKDNDNLLMTQFNFQASNSRRHRDNVWPTLKDDYLARKNTWLYSMKSEVLALLRCWPKEMQIPVTYLA